MKIKTSLGLAICILLGFVCVADAQSGKRGGATAVPDNPQSVGDAGIAWYTTWETGLAEAKRSNRPIFFMSAATTCSGIPGVF